jgi:two-component system, chemotaxis family, chemotaxis protein CheY
VARILVVDDVDVVRLVIGKILKRAGHSVEDAGSGDHALARVAVRAPDAVITDLWMPGSDGLSLIHLLQERFPAVAVIAMTGGSPQCSQQVSISQARDAGVVQVLMKPIDKDELVNAIGAVLESKCPGQSRQPSTTSPQHR